MFVNEQLTTQENTEFDMWLISGLQSVKYAISAPIKDDSPIILSGAIIKFKEFMLYVFDMFNFNSSDILLATRINSISDKIKNLCKPFINADIVKEAVYKLHAKYITIKTEHKDLKTAVDKLKQLTHIDLFADPVLYNIYVLSNRIFRILENSAPESLLYNDQLNIYTQKLLKMFDETHTSGGRVRRRAKSKKRTKSKTRRNKKR